MTSSEFDIFFMSLSVSVSVLFIQLNCCVCLAVCVFLFAILWDVWLVVWVLIALSSLSLLAVLVNAVFGLLNFYQIFDYATVLHTEYYKFGISRTLSICGRNTKTNKHTSKNKQRLATNEQNKKKTINTYHTALIARSQNRLNQSHVTNSLNGRQAPHIHVFTGRSR